MKTLFAIKSMNVLGGGAERVLADVANGLVARGHDIGIMTFDYPGQSFYDLDQRIVRHDMAFNTPGTSLSAGAFLKSIAVIRATVRSANPDLIIPFMHSTYVPIAIATAGMRITKIFSEHIDATHYRTRPIERGLTGLCRRTSIASTIPSETARQSYPPAIARSFVVIPNPIDARKFAVRSDTCTDMGFCILSVGRFMEQKDQITLVRAFAAVRADFPDWRLKIIGDGPLRTALEAEIAALAIGEFVSLPGSTRDMPEAYAGCAFVVIPSRYESFGMVAIEAMASQRAVLAFDDCSGVTEIIESGRNGLLVSGQGSPAVRVQSLAAGLRQLMGDSDLRDRFGKAGPAAIEQFSIETILDRWEALIATSLSCYKDHR